MKALLGLLASFVLGLGCRAHPAASLADAGDEAPTTEDAGPSAVVVTVEPDGTDEAAPLLNAIVGAEAAVDVEMYLLTNATYLKALVALHDRGVEVRVVLNRSFPSGTYAEDTNDSSFATLLAAGIDVHWAPTDTGFRSYAHQKVVLIDPGTSSAMAWIMTMNLDAAGPRSNREYLVTDTTAADIAEAEAIFEADFAGAIVTPSGPLVVAPAPQNNAVSALSALVASASVSIDLEAEELDDVGVETPLFQALLAKAASGVAVRVVLEEDSSDWEQTSAVEALLTAGGQVVGYRYGEDALDIHAKALVADGARAYVGSENFAGGSLGDNREIGVVFTDPVAVSTVDTTILGDFGAGSPYPSP